MRILIIGAGDVGFDIVNRLAGEDHDIVLVEESAERCEMIRDQLDVIVVEGDGTSVNTLKSAGIETMDLVIGVTEEDNTNLVACMLAHQFGVPKKIARVTRSGPDMDENAALFKELTNIDSLINPHNETAAEITELLRYPWATDVMQFADGRVLLVGTRLDGASPLVGRTLAEIARDPALHRVVIAAITRGGETLIPRGFTRIEKHDLVFLLGKPEAEETMLLMAGKTRQKVERVMIVGGGEIGRMLAERLEEMKVASTLIERRRDRCLELARDLHRTLIIQGDGTDAKLLRSEDVGDADYFVAVTGDEETNVITSLLVKQYYPRCKTVCQVRRGDYIPLMLEIGLDAAVSSRVVTINAIMKYVRMDDVVAVRTFKESDAEILEMVIAADSEAAGQSLRSLKFPRDAIVGTVVRDGEIIIPDGNTELKPHDKVIIFALPGAIEGVENIFAHSGTERLLQPILNKILNPFRDGSGSA